MLFVIGLERGRPKGLGEGVVAEDRGRPMVCAQHGWEGVEERKGDCGYKC